MSASTPSPAERGMHLQLTHLAAQLAVDAGRMVKAGRATGLESVETKSSATDVVTEYDKAAERMIVEAIVAARPNDGFLGEEGTAVDGSSGVAWLIDPIDGTTNFLYGLAGYGVSIAALVDGNVVAGAVYVPSTDELFRATLGCGATCNGLQLRCSTTDTLATALIATGFGYRAEWRSRQARRMVTILPSVRDIRRLGAAAPDLCYVAAGRLDGYFEQYLNPWDEAAGMLIATEAGALVGTFDPGHGEPPGRVAANPLLFGPLIELIESAPTT